MNKKILWSAFATLPLIVSPIVLVSACSSQSAESQDLKQARNNVLNFMNDNVFQRGFKKASETKVSDLPILEPKQNLGFTMKWEKISDDETKDANDEQGYKSVTLTLTRQNETLSEKANILGFLKAADAKSESDHPALDVEKSLNIDTKLKAIVIETLKKDQTVDQALEDLKADSSKINEYVQVEKAKATSSRLNSIFKTTKPTEVELKIENNSLKKLKKWNLDLNMISFDVRLKTTDGKNASRPVRVILGGFKTDQTQYLNQDNLKRWLNIFASLDNPLKKDIATKLPSEITTIDQFKALIDNKSPWNNQIEITYKAVENQNNQTGSIDVIVDAKFKNKPDISIQDYKLRFYGFKTEIKS